MLFVRSLEMPSYRRMALSAERQGPPPIKGGQREQDGYAVYAQFCASCHGPGQAPMRTPAKLGADGFRSLIRQGKEQMPPFPEAVLSAERVEALEAYLLSLPLADTPAEESSGERMLRLPPNPNRYSGPATRYAGSFSAGWYTSNGLPAVGPPWTQLVAYDLNDGTIKWRVADGQAPGLADKDIPLTGTVRPRNGPVVTAGGLVFAAELTGSHAARLRQRYRQGALGPRARGEPGGNSRRVPTRRPAVHRFCGRRVVGHGNRSGVEERVSPQGGADRGAGVLRVRAARK